jgi:hypothetical protein
LDSETATQIGSGLISKSLGVQAAGVAEGLRQTMVGYISAVKEDYLAHPYFWAAFVIAGDGAVRPLDGSTAIDESQYVINTDWDHLSSNSADSEFMGLAKAPQSTFAVGIQKPPSGEMVAGSYFVEIQDDGKVAVISRDAKMAASGVVSLGTDIGLLGYYTGSNKSSAVFRLLEKNGQERWRYVEDSLLWSNPVNIITTAEGYVLISIEKDFSPSLTPSTLVLTLVSASGVAIKQRRIPVPIHSGWASMKSVAIDGDGNIIIAIVGTITEKSATQPTMWTNPRTGSKKYCTNADSTALFSIGIGSLELQSTKLLEGDKIVSIHQRDGHLYAAISFGTNCHFEKNIRLVEIGPQFALRSIFQTSNVNSTDIRDFIITPEHFVLVGGIRTFLPTAVTRETVSFEKIIEQNPWDDSFWEKSEDHENAFVLIIKKDGTQLADLVLPDLRNRSIVSVASTTPNHFTAVGSAFGDRGWVVAFSLRKPVRNFRTRLDSLLNRVWPSFGGAH